LFVPVFVGLLWTKTPWWSAIASVTAGVVAVLGVGVYASVQSGDSHRMNVLFSDVE
jgi:VIT1/CCC1 family predicted Fe2+/Mn2+ transporter